MGTVYLHHVKPGHLCPPSGIAKGTDNLASLFKGELFRHGPTTEKGTL
jgi:hypothetical protein